MVCGIYMIKNNKTNQKYIGQSIDIYRRWKTHILGHNQHSYIDNAIQKYGQDNFSLIIVEEIEDKTMLNQREQYWIQHYNTYENSLHYNLTPGGDFNPSQVPEIAKKISNAMKGKSFTKEHKNNISEAKKHKKLSQQHQKNISKAHNTSGYYRVCKNKNNRCKQGFVWYYRYYDNDGKRHAIVSTNINKLEQKVKSQNLPWYKLTGE